jgi:peptidoglycan DL-endopeptidase CwlO
MRPGGMDQLHRRRPGAAVLACLLAAAMGLTGGPAWASTTATSTAPTTGANPAESQAKAARIAAALESLGRQRDRLAERLDQATIHADQVAVQVADGEARFASAGAQVTSVLSVVRRQAIAVYIVGGQTSFLAFQGGRGADDMVRRQAYASTVAGAKQDALHELRHLRRQLDAARARLADEQRSAAAALAAVVADGQAAARSDAAQRATLRQVQGDMAVLVAAQQAQRAALESARVQAKLAPRPAGTVVSALAAAVIAAAPVAPRPPPPAPRTPPPPPPPPPAPTVAPPAPRAAPPPSPGNQPARGWQTAIAAAQSQLGKPYQWGAAGPGSFDCSGLTMWAWAKAGVSMPHLAQAQYAMTRRIPIADLLPGDLVFYGTPSNVFHVGIYVGGGTMLDAPTTGEFVHYAGIYFSGLLAGGRIAD